MTDNTYNVLKKVALIYFPAFTTLVATIGSIWGIPYIQPIVATLTAIDTCIGACLGISSINYYSNIQDTYNIGEDMSKGSVEYEDNETN